MCRPVRHHAGFPHRSLQHSVPPTFLSTASNDPSRTPPHRGTSLKAPAYPPDGTALVPTSGETTGSGGSRHRACPSSSGLAWVVHESFACRRLCVVPMLCRMRGDSFLPSLVPMLCRMRGDSFLLSRVRRMLSTITRSARLGQTAGLRAFTPRYRSSCPPRVLRAGTESFPALHEVVVGRAAAHIPQGLPAIAPTSRKIPAFAQVARAQPPVHPDSHLRREPNFDTSTIALCYGSVTR